MIPTRNREQSLRRTLGALAGQVPPPEETLVVDAGDRPLDPAALASSYPGLGLTCLRAPAGLCGQRNLGIRSARGSHVLLLDDDVELPPGYLAALGEHAAADPAAGAVTGIWLESEGGPPAARDRTVPSPLFLFFALVFQVSVWGDVDAARARGRFADTVLAAIRRWYRRRGNGWSLAGWPLVTQVHGEVVRTATYSLGSALVRRDWLLASPFDERLGPHGIGDHYGVALGFPGERAITVLANTPVLHHRAAENRLDRDQAYVERVLALDYFVRTSGRFPRSTIAWLCWSLLGHAAAFTVRGPRARARRALGALALVATGRNPLLSRRGAP